MQEDVRAECLTPEGCFHIHPLKGGQYLSAHLESAFHLRLLSDITASWRPSMVQKNATYTSVMWKVLLSELAIKVWEYLHIHSFWIVFKLIYSLEIVSTLVDDLYVILECLSFHELPPLTAATLSHVDKWCTSFLRPALSFGNKCFLKFLHLHLGALCKTRQLLSETWRLHQGALRHLPGGRGLLAAMGFPPKMPGRGGMGFAWGPYCLGVCCLSSRRDMCRVLGYPESHVFFRGFSFWLGLLSLCRCFWWRGWCVAQTVWHNCVYIIYHSLLFLYFVLYFSLLIQFNFFFWLCCMYIFTQDSTS